MSYNFSVNFDSSSNKLIKTSLNFSKIKMKFCNNELKQLNEIIMFNMIEFLILNTLTNLTYLP